MTILRNLIKTVSVATVLTACDTPLPADREFTVATWGGGYTDNQRAAFFDPFTAASGTKVIDGVYTGGMGELQSMAETGNPIWDVVDFGGPETVAACREGLIEPIDFSRVENIDALGATAEKECGVGFVAWSMILAYNIDLTGDQPKSWKDFWDLEKYPGKRGLRNSPQYALEGALFADGVSDAEVYKLLATEEGVDRAFAKLDEIKEHIHWWSQGAQPPELLKNESIVMSTSYVGRVLAAAKEGAPVALGWDDGFHSTSYWVIVKDSPNQDDAYDYINFTTAPKPLAEFGAVQGMAPLHKDSAALIPVEKLKDLPAGKNLMHQHALSDEFWVDNLETLTNRFNTWVAQ
jgi:putative spermidine/putrescine transport system substrate-binding protein